MKMRSLILGLLAATSIASLAQTGSKLSTKWEELTGPDFVTAIQQAHGVCMLPFGIIEKHGPHLPLGTDLINVRYATEHAALTNTPSSSPPTTSARSPKPNTSPAPSPTACTCNSISCRKPPTRWAATAAKKSSS